MDACKDSDLTPNAAKYDRLWWLALCILVYGYVYMLLAYGVCMLGVGFFYTYSSWSDMERSEVVEASGSTGPQG